MLWNLLCLRGGLRDPFCPTFKHDPEKSGIELLVSWGTMKTRSIHFLYRIGSGFLFLSLVIRILLTWNRRFNADEFQHLHASWMVHAGYFPYRDFWENHSPLLYYFLAPAFSLFGEGVSLIFTLRAFFSAVALFIVLLTYFLARLDHDRLTSLLSALVLSFSVIFLQKTIEIRPDQFLVILWLASLWIIIRSSRMKKNGIQLTLAGFLLGIAMLFSPKTLLCYFAAILTFAACFTSHAVQPTDRIRRLLRISGWCLFYTLGFLIPVSACALFFWHENSLDLLIKSTLLTNLNYPHAWHPMYLLSLQHIVLFLLGFAGITICLRERRTFESTYDSRFLLGVPCVFLLIIFLFAMPAPYPQSALIFIPLLAIYCGIAFKKSLDWVLAPGSSPSLEQKLFLAFTLFAALLVPCGSFLVREPSMVSNTNQLELIRAVLNHTKRSDVFFDGNAAYIFRRQAYYYGSLVEGIREGPAKGEIERTIPKSLKNNHCKFIIYDDRVAQLPTTVQDFIRNNYIPTPIPNVLVAGKELRAESFSGRRVKFWIEIPLSYNIRMTNGNRFLIDGKPYQSSIFLTTGPHNLVAEEQLRFVQLRAADR
jgi:4-amino-4-deoxy-L-arabinose transferase-like glycosyltransferase